MRIFVAGATGVIGARAIPLLVAAGHDVTAVGRTPDKRALLERLGARAVTVDLFDPGAVHRAVVGYDTIVNLATAVPAPVWRGLLPGAWREMDRVRRLVSANLVEAAIAAGTAKRFIQESFAPIYADSGDRWIDESSPVQPGKYNRSVLDAESNAERFSRAGGSAVVLRFGGLYGPNDPATAQILDTVRRGWFPLFGRPESWFSFVAFDDAAAAVAAALGVPDGIYNVVEREPLRRRELADGLARLLGVKPPRFLPSWTARLAGSLGETLSRSLRISSRKLEQASEWSPKFATTLDGLAVVVARTT
ncbi:MAG TPA: NAD-dependent epimerase/dehydratase family protein [Gemmatimonadaceae bacterium]|nr:NAD-dependent epimerase/dehydratase family protein [Gemmatimonadaceae bacterium]